MSDELTEFPTKLNPLPIETRWEAQEKRKARKIFAQTFGPFVKAMREVIDAYLQARAEGVSRVDAAKGVEAVLRSVWPFPPTKFGPQCLICDDIGYEELLCRVWARCRREKCVSKGEDWQHLYVVPCTCQKGDKFRPRTYTPDDAMAQVGKVSKPKKGWSKL